MASVQTGSIKPKWSLEYQNSQADFRTFGNDSPYKTSKPSMVPSASEEISYFLPSLTAQLRRLPFWYNMAGWEIPNQMGFDWENHQWIGDVQARHVWLTECISMTQVNSRLMISYTIWFRPKNMTGIHWDIPLTVLTILTSWSWMHHQVINLLGWSWLLEDGDLYGWICLVL